MAEQKKKNKSTYLADYADKEKKKLPNRRMNSMQKKKGSTTTRTYQAETLGMPALKMILVHAENERANAAEEPVIKAKRLKVLTQEETVMKIIEHLKGQ